MAEVINFAQKKQERARSVVHEDADDDIINAKIVSKETFYGLMELLEELGYDVNEDPQMIRDLEALSFLSAGIVFRAHKNEHPGSEMLDASYVILSNVARLFDELEADNDNAQTDNSL